MRRKQAFSDAPHVRQPAIARSPPRRSPTTARHGKCENEADPFITHYRATHCANFFRASVRGLLYNPGMRIPTCLLGLALLMCGCAHYEYDVVRPPDLTGHVGAKADAILHLDPLEYRLRTVESRLVMRIFNPSAEPITLRGDRSVIVDPNGQSHPLRSQTIAPGSYIKLILPPFRPRIENYGPSFGIGMGVGVARVNHRHYFLAPTAPGDVPRYFDLYDDANAFFWEWPGETNVQITLVYQRSADKEFTHVFEFHRRKM
jgi:hypothetical protein